MVSRAGAARGFTLAELMAVVAIMAILAAVAAPSFNQMIASQRAKGVSSDLFAALSRTRSEAIKRNTEVTLLPVSASAWQDGWRIPNPANTGDKLDDHGPVRAATVAGPASVVYLANGRIKGASAPSFDVSVDGLAQHRCITVDLSGRPYQTSTGC